MEKKYKSHIPIEDYLKMYGEEMPMWLRCYRPGNHVSFSDFMEGRVAYYPGSGLDACLVDVAASAGCVHSFLYVDYYTRRKDIESFLEGRGFRGYRSIGRVEFLESDLMPYGQHRLDFDYKPRYENATAFVNRAETPYCFMEILERCQHYGSETSSGRIAITFLFADGIMTYYQLFVREYRKSPWLFLLIDHGFGGNYDVFGGGGLLEKIIIEHCCSPKFVLCYKYNSIWPGYTTVEGLESVRGGMHDDERILYERTEKSVKTYYYAVIESDKISGVFCNESDCNEKQFMVLEAEDGVLTLPTYYRGRKIVGVKDFWCMGGQIFKTPTIRGLIVPDSYHYIGQKNFSQYKNLEFVYLPQTVRLRSFAFAYCANLKKIFVGSPDNAKQWRHTSMHPDSIYKGDIFDIHPHGLFERCHPDLLCFV